MPKKFIGFFYIGKLNPYHILKFYKKLYCEHTKNYYTYSDNSSYIEKRKKKKIPSIIKKHIDDKCCMAIWQYSKEKISNSEQKKINENIIRVIKVMRVIES